MNTGADLGGCGLSKGGWARQDWEGPLSREYERGRAFPAGTHALWSATLRRYLPAASQVRVIDIGSGTGRFAGLFARDLGVDVVGIEPARAMVAKALPCEHVRYLRGRAESLPVRDATCDVAFLSMVLHHLQDLPAAIAELSRVLRPRARAIFRSGFSGRLEGATFYELFPAGLAVDDARMPTVDRVLDLVRPHGFQLFALERVVQATDDSWADYNRRLRTWAYSTLHLLGRDDLSRGLATAEAWAADETVPSPVLEPVDLLVVERIGGPRRH